MMTRGHRGCKSSLSFTCSLSPFRASRLQTRAAAMASQRSESTLSVSQHAHLLVHELFLEPAKRPIDYVRRAAAAAWYPIRGIWYFLRNREFWPLWISRLLPLTIISFIVYFVLFAFAFLPQFAFLAIFHGWGALPNAVVLVLGEGYIIIQVGAVCRASDRKMN